MKIILSPAKKMRVEENALPCLGLPGFLDKTSIILEYLRGLDHSELQTLWGCNESIASQNIMRLEQMDLRKNLTPAVLSYDGIAFQHLSPGIMEENQLQYLQDHLRILSGFYGSIRAFDGVCPYRLEMQTKVNIANASGLYEFWGSDLYHDCIDTQDRLIVNLASKEYSKCISDFLAPNDHFLTCHFVEQIGDRMVQKATFAKMARGEMVRYMAEQNVTEPDQLKKFHSINYSFRPDLSSQWEYFFERKP